VSPDFEVGTNVSCEESTDRQPLYGANVINFKIKATAIHSFGNFWCHRSNYTQKMWYRFAYLQTCWSQIWL